MGIYPCSLHFRDGGLLPSVGDALGSNLDREITMYGVCRSSVSYQHIAADHARAQCSTRRRRGAEKPSRFKRVALCRKHESGRRLSRKVMSANNDGGDFLLDYTLPQHEVAEEPIPWDTKCIRDRDVCADFCPDTDIRRVAGTRNDEAVCDR